MWGRLLLAGCVLVLLAPNMPLCGGMIFTEGGLATLQQTANNQISGNNDVRGAGDASPDRE